MSRGRIVSHVRALGVLVLIAGAATPAYAHKPSDAHVLLDVDGDQITGRVEIAVRDLDAALAIDDGDGRVTWGELAAAEPRITAYLAARLAIASGGSAGGESTGCRTAYGAPSLVDLSDGTYWSVPLEATCDRASTALSVRYELLFDVDAQHRGLVHVGDQTVVVRDGEPVTITLGASSSTASFVREGIWHIWIGLDHILFLLCLLLPAVFPRAGTPQTLRTVCLDVFQVVTAFTLAHSITLVISAVGLITLPSRLVETAIAASVVAAAVNNLVRAVDARWAVAFALGLLHGFGFSSVLVDLGLPSGQLVGALLGFNLGVELGQAGIVIAVLPILYAIRSTLAYRALVYGGSGAAALLASFWVYQRCWP